MPKHVDQYERKLINEPGFETVMISIKASGIGLICCKRYIIFPTHDEYPDDYQNCQQHVSAVTRLGCRSSVTG